ncbi:hypothetical protein BDV93DRAFT_584181 [Ceratobasidium sp. AG-I]|nr:hypothetical protein BDV93DRAFT_584181 [Ceratobasidium sp. AG-I]
MRFLIVLIGITLLDFAAGVKYIYTWGIHLAKVTFDQTHTGLATVLNQDSGASGSTVLTVDAMSPFKLMGNRETLRSSTGIRFFPGTGSGGRHYHCIPDGSRKASPCINVKEKCLDAGLLESENPVFVENDLSVGGLGLGSEVYNETQSSATVIIHNTWQVNCSLYFQPFESSILGPQTGGKGLPLVPFGMWNAKSAAAAAPTPSADEAFKRFSSTKIQGMIDGMNYPDQEIRELNREVGVEVEAGGMAKMSTTKAEGLSGAFRDTGSALLSWECLAWFHV